MHDTALISGKLFSETYGKPGMIVIDFGGQDVNGSLRCFFENNGMKYICIDMVSHPSVDLVIQPYEKLPFEDSSIDMIVSTSCFEHDPCFWITFKEMCRIVKLDGFIYINAPSYGPYHTHPGDNWRFYSDAGQALAFWSGKKMHDNDVVHAVEVIETFHILPINDTWYDFICVFKKTNKIDDAITIRDEISNLIGPLRTKLHENGLKTISKIRLQ